MNYIGIELQVSNNKTYHTLNLLSLFWLAENVRWIIEISARDVITADYTMIMSRTLKVTGNHVMYDCGAWFPRIIMSSSHALCCLPSVKKQKHDSYLFCSMYNKTIIILLDSVFCDIQCNQGLGKVISLSLQLRLITLTSASIFLDITKTSSNNYCLLSLDNYK